MAIIVENKQWVHVDAIVRGQNGKVLVQGNVQATDRPQPVVKGSVRGANVRRDRQASFAMQVLAESGVKRLPRRSADAIRAGAKHQGRPPLGLGQHQQIPYDANLTYARIVFNARLQSRMESISERGPHGCAGNLI